MGKPTICIGENKRVLYWLRTEENAAIIPNKDSTCTGRLCKFRFYLFFQTFSNCSCVEVGSGANVSSVSAANCTSGCGLMYLFIVMFFCVIFTTFLPSTPSDAATLR